MRKLLARSLLVFLLLSISLMLAQAQSCGLTDTFVVAQNSSLSFDITISDYFNDDLSDADQGLCGIELGFVHQYVENFEVTLTSPAGQSINLIGPNSDDDFDFTFGAQWQIDFVDCGTLAAPDPVFSPQWDNTQSENWVNFGQYFGSYHPYIGCLEDFNTGSVNGNWTITVNNNPSNYLGAITFLNLVFCDSRGVECCFVTPGIFLNQDIIACEGADTLLIDPNRFFPLGLADTTEFGYAYLISQEGIYTQLDSMLDFRDSLAGNYQVCGFSYRRDELVNLPDANSILTIDEIRANLDGLTPWLCAELTMECIDVQIVAKPDTTFLEERICIGDSIVIGLDTFHQTGQYSVDLLSFADCDSTIVLDLFVQDVQMTMVDSILCLGDSSVIGSSVYYSTGLYRDTLQSSELGCDSIVELSLTILDPVFTEISPTICAGDNYLVGDSLLQMTGMYEILLTSETGCDSLVTVNLQVLNPEAIIGTTTPIDCNNPIIELDANESIPFDDLMFKWLDTDEMELGLTPTLSVETAGIYILEVTQTLNEATCISRDTMTIEDVRIYPIADPGPDTILTCEHPLLLLGGDQTTIEANIQYEWQLLSQGHFTSTPLIRQVEVDSAGIYQFIVSNMITGCADTATVEVTVNQTLPIVDPGLGFELNCAILEDTLDGSASLIEDDFVLTWGGPCVEELVEPGLILVNCLGEYSLNVYNPVNGCSDQATVMVTQNIEQPVAIIETPDTLDCVQLSVQLEGHLSTPIGSLDYQWIDPQSSILIGDQPQVSLPGIYDLIVTRQDNSCKDTTSITVIQDTIRPIADIQANTVLTCREPSILLGGPMTSIGDDYSYRWLENGQPIIGQTTDTLRVNILGTYSLIVENSRNGCQDTTSIEITENFLPPPVVQAGSNQFLDCANESVQLQPDSTLFSNPVTYQWSGPCILEPSQDWGIYVNCPGTYFLEVTNVDNGCFGVDSVQVNVSDNYSIAELPSSLYLSCETGEVVIDTEGSSNGTQRWFLNEELLFLPGPNPTVSEAGIYTLIIDNNQMTCSDTASVEVFVECEVQAIVALSDTLSCRNESVVLDASNSVGQGELSYQWSTMMDMGCIIGPSNLSSLEIVCPGDYQIIVSNDEINERDTLIISVLRDTIRPVVYAGENVMLDCIQTEAHLIGSIEGDPLDFTVAWTNFATDDTLGQVADYYTTSSGVYLFTAENIVNGCRRSDLVQVNLDTFTPGIAFGDEFFSCNEDSFHLQAFVQPVAGNYSYLWSRVGTGIVDDADSLSVLIEEIGLYTFTVTNENNGCDSTATVEVFEENCEPCIQISTVDTLNCQTDIITLSASFCQPCVGCTLQWSLNNDDILDANSLSLEVSEPGNYTLTTTDMIGLSSDTTVMVISMIEEPSFSLGPDLIKGCNDTNFVLSAQQLSAEEPLQYEWFELGETIVISDETELVVSDGAYRLVITQLLTGCSASDTINIYENFEEPIADAGNNRTITCGSTAIVLDGGNSTLTNASYEWSTSQPTCLSGEESLNPIVSCPGWYFLTVTNIDNGCTAIDSVEVFIADDLPSLTPFPDTILSCIQTPITLIGNIPSDGGDYEYRWCELDDLGQEISMSCQYNNLEYEVTTAGVYEFTVENLSTNCINSFDVNVSMDTLPPIVNAGEQDTLFCTLSSLVLEGVVEENATYNWSTTEGHPISNANSLMPTVFQPGWYVLSVESNQNGCTSADSVLIVRDEETPILEAGVDTILDCRNEEIELNAIGETVSGQFEWLWTSPDGQIEYGTNSATAGISDTAWYFVNLTDPVSGCQITDSLFVGRDIRQPEAMIDDFDDLQLTCFQDTLLLDASLSNSITGVGLTFDWEVIVPGNLFPDTQAEQIFTDSIGYYKLTVEDMGNGCLDTLYFNVSPNLTPPDVAFAIPDTITCMVEEIELHTIPPTNPDGVLFEWMNPDLEVIGNLESALTDNSGWHYLQLQDEENGCLTLDSVLVHSNAILPSILIDPPLPITCDREIVILDASASSSGDEFIYQWQGLDGNEIIGEGQTLQDSTSLLGLYQLTIINTETGCEDTKEVTVQSDGELITGLDIAVIDPPCEGDLLGSISINDVIGGTPNFTYSLNNMGQGNFSFFEDLEIGTYEIKVVDSQGCYLIETVEIIPASEFQVNLGDNDDIQLGDSLQLSPQFNRPADSLNWYAPDYQGTLTGLKPYITPFETQFVVLQAFDENGCSSRDTIQIFVINNRPSFIPTAFSPNGDGNNDFFTVYTNSDVVEIKTLRIFSRWGNMVFERNNFSPNDPLLGWDGTFEGQPLNTAVFVYYVELIYQDQWIEEVVGDILLMNIE